MDDPKTRQSIDELAQHYLTGVAAASISPSHDPAKLDALTGPAPIRLAPKPVAAAMQHTGTDPQALRTGDPQGPRDGHPILRLTEESQPAIASAEPEGFTNQQPPARTTGKAQANKQAVILGNLPGLSGPWLTQYAQRLAQEHGPVAIVHVDETMIDLEIVEPRLQASPAPHVQVAATRIPPMAEGEGLVGLLDALVRSEQSPVRTVLVRLSAQAEAMSASRLGALEDWTVLCGADDAAVVACYSMLKRSVENDPRHATKRVGLMVMGSDEDAAKRAVQKVASTADSFLSTPVTFAGNLKQMQPVTVRQMGTFPDPIALWPQLVAWLDALEAPAATTTLSPTPNNTITPHLEPIITSPLATPTMRRPAAPTPHPAPQLVAPPTAPRTAQPVTQQTTAAAKRDNSANDLFALLAQGPAAIAGGLALEARVPAAPAIQLAVDGQGVVHLLMHHDLADDPRRAVPEMMEARRWVSEQRELLALTQRDRAFADVAPVMHLFTDRAEQATALVARLGDSLKLHLLQKVTLGRETGWFCTPLN